MISVTFQKLSFAVAGSVFGALGIITNPTQAAMISFQGSDPGAAMLNVSSNSVLAAADFDVAAQASGITHLINFENLPTGTFSAVNVESGVIATLNNNDGGGISSEQSVTYGYNTTTSGSHFLQFRPTFGIYTASLDFSFIDPIQGFGAYITGLGTAAGSLNIIFDNETTQELAVSGNPFGGSLFVGFIDPEKLIRNISLSLSGVTSSSRDIFGLDDIRYVSACSVK